MRVLEKTVLAGIAGGEAVAGGSDEYDLTSLDFLGWGGSSGGGGSGSGMLLDFGAKQDSVGGFDSSGVGPNGCVPAPAAPASGLFGLSLTETIGAGTAAIGVVAGISQGVGASLAIETADGLSGVGAMGSGAASLLGSAGLGLGSAAVAGYAVGTVLYNSSETVRDWAGAVVGAVIRNGGAAADGATGWLLYGPHGEGRLVP